MAIDLASFSFFLLWSADRFAYLRETGTWHGSGDENASFGFTCPRRLCTATPDLKVELERAASFGFRKVVRTEELEKIESEVLVQPKRRPAWTNLPEHIRKCITCYLEMFALCFLMER